MIVTIVLIYRHKRKRKTEEKKYHDQTANNALSNKAYNTQTNDRNQISKYVEQEDAVIEIAEYNYIQDDNVQQDTEEYASCSSHYEITDESNENNMHYNHLSPQVSPVFKANYSELCLNPNNTEITISDNTYSHLPADDDKTDTKRAETIDNTYNKLEFNTFTPTDMIKQTHGCNTEIEDSEYCHANAGGKDRKPVSGNYSHLAQNKSASTRVTPFRRGVAADGYEQPISIGKHLYVDLEQGHQDVSPHCSVVEMRDDNNSGTGTNDEGPGHEYFVLEKEASSGTQ